MLHNARAALARREDEGFTLIELMVVVLIIAILIAIAIPTFLGARNRAQDRAAQSNLRNALTNAKAIFTDNEDYTTASANSDAALTAAEPSLTFQAAASTAPKQVSVDTPSASSIVMASLSKSGKCFAVKDDASGPGTKFGTVTSGACTGANAGTGGGVTSWADSW